MFIWIFNEIKFNIINSIFLVVGLQWIDIIKKRLFKYLMYSFSSFATGGFVPSAALSGFLILIGLAVFFYLGIKGPKDY